MWTPAAIAALCTGIAGVITAAAVLVRQWRHTADPAAHDGQGHPPPSPPAPLA